MSEGLLGFLAWIQSNILYELFCTCSKPSDITCNMDKEFSRLLFCLAVVTCCPLPQQSFIYIISP